MCNLFHNFTFCKYPQVQNPNQFHLLEQTLSGRVEIRISDGRDIRERDENYGWKLIATKQKPRFTWLLRIWGSTLRKRLAGPQDQRCCWNRNALNVLGSSFLHSRSWIYTNFQPHRLARTARSMSSTVVRSFQPPASSIARMRHTPAVPALSPSTKNSALQSGFLFLHYSHFFRFCGFCWYKRFKR